MDNQGRGSRGGSRGGSGGASNSRTTVREDPRVDRVLRALEEIGNPMGRQIQERAAAIAQAAEARIALATVAAHGVNVNQGNDIGNRQMHQLVEQFLKLKLAKFIGKGDLQVAPHWIEDLEKAYEVLGYTEEEKVTLVVYRLRDTAIDWWKPTKGRVFPEGTALNWTVFTEVFNGKYFSKSAQEHKMLEFQRLHQNQMTIDRYKAEFSRLSKYAPWMGEIPLDRARRFRDGLRPELRSRLIILNPRDYDELYERGKMVERDMKDRAAASA
ncbi:uncharacterized protein LOC115746980 [Rhodamnia argentea]|uniref:Uncharacterized protein LOC115746980 n=1 Tax=Rhodamnia argentea TaxID=178133 RepID=A0A8B8PVP0_9MYRT|nr:uncharacterized protein LOC115746980 [Rhodamnia argentea]